MALYDLSGSRGVQYHMYMPRHASLCCFMNYGLHPVTLLITVSGE